MRWVERDVSSPRDLDTRVGVAVDALLDSTARLAVSELTIVEFRSAVTVDWRKQDAQSASFDATWADRGRASLMARLAGDAIDVVPVPPHAAEHAMTLVDIA